MLWRVQQYQPVHQSRQSSFKTTGGAAKPAPEPRDHQLPAWQCSELQPRSTPRLTARVPVRKAYRHRAYQGPDSRYDRWYRTSHTAAPPSTVMNSRRLMPSSSPRTTTYHIEWKLLCVTAKWRARLPLWVISRHLQLCDLLHIWHSPLLLVCKHANRGNRLLGTGIGSRWHPDDRNHDLDCCSGSPGQPVDQIGIGKAPAPAHVQNRGDSVFR